LQEAYSYFKSLGLHRCVPNDSDLVEHNCLSARFVPDIAVDRIAFTVMC